MDLSDMARRMQQGEIQQGSFDGPAKGMEAMGEAVGKAGNVFQALGERMAQSKNQADLSRVEAILSQARAAHAQEIQGLPEDQWVSTWEEKYRPQIEQQIGALHFSPWARDRVEPQLIQYDAATRTSLAYDAYKQTASRNEQDIQNGITTSLQAGDYEGVYRGIDRLVAGHLITPEQAQAKRLQYQDQAERQMVQQAINANPQSVMEDTTEAKKTNLSKLLPYLNGKPDEIARAHNQATEQVRQQEYDAFNSAQDDLTNGSTIEEIKQRYGAALPDRKLHILEKAARSYREWDPAVDGPITEQLRADIANYHRDADRDLNTLDLLQHRIADLPRNKQGYLNSLLAQQYEKTSKPDKDPVAHDQQLAYWLSESARLGQAGYLGETGRSRKNFNVITDPKQSAAYGEKLQNIRVQLQDWSKQNPKATPQQWRDQFYQTVQPYTDNQAANIWSSGPASAPAAAAQPSPVPVTNYSLGRDVGGPDPVQDFNTNRGYSSNGPNLTPGAAAVNTSRYPIGTIFQDHDTGEIFLATDRHGNDDPNVVDLYQSPDRYQDTKTTRNLSVIGRAAHIPHNAEALRKLLASLGKVPEGESAAETLARLKGSNLASK